MKPESLTAPSVHLAQDLLTSLLLLTLSLAGGWLASQSLSPRGMDSVHQRLLMILLVQPFALAAWFFCGLPGLGLALQSLFTAITQRRVTVTLLSAGLLALALVSATLWI
ncbi:hypothetical protein EI77_02369 [Prosthecobacter fusiformis]|uniref:Uncharacterized protein n=1 Tax=Prosthecobacter fusiformis TaxID=48464 RepID=A0A4R7S2M1_9BACT|nr:hypothetical protein [Prosthecobacter fusiformis]TDU71247.1 hypothetical protein EI77_02369 [Prosthecobacter fusiformis]